MPRKNVLPVAGRPLIAHTIAQARASRHITRIIVSTDDEEIALVSRNAGADVIPRPQEISGDLTTSEIAIAHALDYLRVSEGYVPELVVFLQCTSPVRKPNDIDRAIETLHSEQADSILSVSPSHKFLWAEVDGVVTSLNYDFRNRPRRQDMLPQYIENGSIYAFKTEMFHNTRNRLGGKIALHIMDEDAGWDIDSPFEMKIAEMLLLRLQGEQR
jgi:N-acylneuraminate cytidylyltransferase